MNLDDYNSDQLAKEEEADREDRERRFRPSWMNQPIEFEGTWGQPARDGEIARDDNGTPIPCWDIPLNDCKFITVDPKDVGRWKDGDVYIWQVAKPKEGGKLSFSALGMILKASKLPSLPSLMGSRIHLKETVLKPFSKAENGTRLYVVKKIGAGAAPAPSEPTQEGVAAALGLLLGEGMTEPAFKSAAMVTAGIGKPLMSGGRNDTVLIEQIGNGSWLEGQVKAGKVVKDGDVFKVAS